MQQSLREVGFKWVVLPLHLRSALRSYYLWRRQALFHYLCRIVLTYCFTIMVAANVADEQLHSPTLVILFFLSIYGGIPTFGAPAHMRQYQLVAECAAAIHVAAVAAQASGSERASAMRQVSVNMRTLERAIFRARRSHRTVVRSRWSRQAVLRNHAERVVATLRAAETQLDGASPNAALEHLVALLLRIASNSAAGRTGVLLPDSLTDEHKDERVRDFELLRVAGVILMMLVAVSGVVVLKVPDIAAGAVVAGVAVLSAIAFFGHGWTRMLSVIELMKGGG
ncbi:hypothetical protein ACFWD7_52475 [Streptomyces mirabilis]|uniref:hypothetical protein n=1 Tax=Streptomyces TaxID=1883 RepID=UPI00225022A8|nr:hypothetical protein [Streptomyces sp. NBC_00365]MCX5097834.1 hypothetical protein [Streptomyces sp. NBC_00365]